MTAMPFFKSSNSMQYLVDREGYSSNTSWTGWATAAVCDHPSITFSCIAYPSSRSSIQIMQFKWRRIHTVVK